MLEMRALDPDSNLVAPRRQLARRDDGRSWASDVLSGFIAASCGIAVCPVCRRALQARGVRK